LIAGYNRLAHPVLPMTEIKLIDAAPSQDIKITQLYERLELFSEGDPPQHTLFILGQREPLTQIESLDQLELLGQSSDQLLLIDPPPDATQRFRLDGDVAALWTGPPPPQSDLPRMQTQSGGLAHVYVGEHFVDIYAQTHSTLVHLPTLGVLCGGTFGSDATLPVLGPGSDGGEELDTLRLLAHLVKERNVQLYIPHVGVLARDRVAIMERLAADVAYLHGLRRVIPAMAQRGDDLAAVRAVEESLLPAARTRESCRVVHRRNVQRLYAAVQNG